MDKVAKALTILRGMEKTGVDVLGGLGEAAKSVDALGKGMAKALSERGHGTSAAVARFLPHIGVAYAGKKLYDKLDQTHSMQKLKHWRRRRQYEKAMRQAQGGY